MNHAQHRLHVLLCIFIELDPAWGGGGGESGFHKLLGGGAGVNSSENNLCVLFSLATYLLYNVYAYELNSIL